MQTQNWRTLSRMSNVTAVVTLYLVDLSILAVAQSEDANAIFASAPKLATKVDGISVFTALPQGFNPLTATNRDLLTYGLPQRPDKVADETGYSVWERAVLSTSTHVTDVQAKPYSSREMMPAGAPKEIAANGATALGSQNWSGIANSNKNTKWNNITSFTQAASVWNVPSAKAPFGASCNEGPWREVSWNGIDGWGSSDVVQGGSASEFGDNELCFGSNYYGWVEWYPSYPITELICGNSPCPASVIAWDMRQADRQFFGGVLESNPTYLLPLRR